jgi:hypothetical protein
MPPFEFKGAFSSWVSAPPTHESDHPLCPFAVVRFYAVLLAEEFDVPRIKVFRAVRVNRIGSSDVC